MIGLKSFPKIVLICVCWFASGLVLAQVQPLAATHKNIPYQDADPAQKLDVYLPKSNKPTPAMIFIHGGGWRAGSKDKLPKWLLDAVQENWLAVVSVEYRFTDVAPHPAQVNDCLRAIQFVRQRAQEWGIDSERIGVTGGSAGGHLSLWVALHDDAANPNSQDPVEKNSSRVRCAISFAGPTDWSLLAKLEHKHPAYRQLLGYEPGTPADEMNARAMIDVSPISFVSEDDPPILQVHGDQDDIVPMEHAQNMEKSLLKANVPNRLVVIPKGTHSVANAAPEVSASATEFVRHQLLDR